MISIDIPGMGHLELTHVLFDLNGTLTTDGVLLSGLAGRIKRLRERLHVRILTADTRGTAQALADSLGVDVQRIERNAEAAQKEAVVVALGSAHVVAVGNGRNDAAMLRAAAVGIAVMGDEGAAGPTIMAADAVVRHVNDAVDLLLDDVRLLSTLRY